MKKLKKQASPENKYNYDLFKLDPKEKLIMRGLNTRKKSQANPNDPYFNKYTDPFAKQFNTIYDTDQELGIIRPYDHSNMLN